MRFRLAVVIVLAAAVPALVGAQISQERWAEIDQLHERDRHDEVLTALKAIESDVSGDTDRAGALWRRARAEFNQIDLALYAGEISEGEAMERLEEIRATAEESIRTAGRSVPAQTYFWRGAVRAKQGDLRGVLNALFMARDLREDLRLAVAADPDYSHPYFLAGQLYEALPGFPISFGDDTAAVSFSRLAVARHEEAYIAGEVPERYWGYYASLGKSLNARGWSQQRRERRIPDMAGDRNSAETAFERAMYYEAEAEIPDRSDQEEASDLLNFVIESLEARNELTVREARSLRHARDLAD